MSDPKALAVWQDVVATAVESGPLLRGLVINCTLIGFTDGKAIVDCPDRFRSQAIKQLPKLCELFTKRVGSPMSVELFDPAAALASAVSSGGDASSNEAATTGTGTEAQDALARVQALSAQPPIDATEHPLVKQAMELFDAKVVDVQPRRR